MRSWKRAVSSKIWCVRRVVDRVEGLDVELLAILAEQKELMVDPLKFIGCDRKFHRTIVQSAGNSLVLAFYESLRKRQVRMGIGAVTSTEDRARQVLKEHHAIDDAISISNCDAVGAAIAEHLMNTLGFLRSPVARNSWAADRAQKEKSQ